MSKFVKLVSLVLTVTLLASCTSQLSNAESSGYTDESIKQNMNEQETGTDITMYSAPESRIADTSENQENPAKKILLGIHTTSIVEYIPEVLSYLLEHGDEFTEEEITLMMNKAEDEYTNANAGPYFYKWYLDRGLNEIDVEVLSIERIAQYTWEDYRSGEDYLLKVNVLKTDYFSDIPLNEQEWVFNYAQITDNNSNVLGPDQLISYNEYQARTKYSEYNKEIMLVQDLRSMCSIDAFADPTELPKETALFFVLYFMEYDRTYTQAEVSAKAQELLGTDLHFDRDIYDKDGNLLYTHKDNIFHGLSSAGGGYSYKFRSSVNYYWRVENDENGLQIYCFQSEKPLKYTIWGGKVVSAVDITNEIIGINLEQITTNRHEYTKEQYDYLRNSVEYKHPDYNSTYIISYPFVQDKTGQALTHFIQSVLWLTMPATSFRSPSEPAARAFTHTAAIYASPTYQWNNPGLPISYVPRFRAFASLYDDKNGAPIYWIYLKEHIEQTAKLIYGEDFIFTHSNEWGAVYYEEGGIYTPSFLGMEYGRHTVILSYEEFADHFEVEAVFPLYTDDKYIFQNLQEVADNELKDYLLSNELGRHKIIIRKGDNNRLIYHAHEIPEI